MLEGFNFPPWLRVIDSNPIEISQRPWIWKNFTHFLDVEVAFSLYSNNTLTKLRRVLKSVGILKPVSLDYPRTLSLRSTATSSLTTPTAQHRSECVVRCSVNCRRGARNPLVVTDEHSHYPQIRAD